MMLEFLRQRTKSWLIYLMFGVIIAVFILTFNPVAGKGGQCGGSAAPLLAEVGASKVDLNTLYMGLALTADPPSRGDSPQASQQDYIYRNTRFYYSGVRPEFLAFNPTPEGVSPIKIQKVMNDLIETYTVSDLAARMGLAVSVDDVTNRVLGTQRFTDPDTGSFNADAYTSFVRYTLKTTKQRYEDFVRREILRDRVIQSIESTVNVPKAEIDFYVQSLAETVNLEYVELTAEVLSKGIETTPEQADEYAASNQDAIKKFFEENTNRFSKPERVKVRGIFFKAPFSFFRDRLKDPAKLKEHDDQWAAAKTSAEAARQTLTAAAAPSEGAANAEGAPGAEGLDKDDKPDAFAALAKEKSEHPASQNDGGLFATEFSQEELSRWPFGKEIGAKAFNLEKGVISEVLAADNGYWIVRIESRLPAFEQNLEQVGKEIAEELMRTEIAKERLGAASKTLIEIARKAPTKGLSEAVDAWRATQGENAASPSVQETGTFTQIPDGPIPPVTENLGKIPRIGNSRALVEAAFKLTTEAPVPEESFSPTGQEDRVYVVRLKERATDEDMESTKTRVEEALSQARARSTFRELVTKLRTGAERSGKLSFSAEFNTMLAQEVKNLEAIVPGVN